MRLARDSLPVLRRDATVPTTVVVVTQVAATTTDSAASTSISEIDLTITILTTITAGAEPATSSSSTSSSAPTTAFSALSLAALAALSVSAPSAISSQSALGSISLTTTSTSLALATTVSLLLSTSLLSSTRLGLAIGIPIAAVCVFGLVVFLLIYLRKRMDLTPTETLAFKLPKTTLARSTNEKHAASSIYLSSDLEQGLEQTYNGRPSVPSGPDLGALQKPTFLKRISRLINVPESPLEFKSPLFLRRFHLLSNKYDAESDERQEKELPKSPATTPDELSLGHVAETGFPERKASSKRGVPELKYVVIKPYTRRLGDELTVSIGEQVSIVDHHSDGWAAVKLTETGEVGVIPLMCVKKFVGKNEL
ncbi:hypothetical protein METBIDRAFT_95463 [Metschnikowia bicuspidata var. bicuspidata NRRL YB-4993]|uniref:SH3 domain-containing protein n=1 Tax=Metschnikowia bicuspidata var. bicuspidata NRRL YB-4993 TaxID=869754 RepID=A0A1A0HGG1_9ASCO|nr:hypothetical protein METBIDRAFT_95463 [Metschnikowia bicuspidata var. bicuspidata NRRL YB-4993]OBA22967.1 hypothetical protein METBIDRAFT_95463 [Metschnikowia bicuspidata var. bicuspidata NRRL YB-4993]